MDYLSAFLLGALQGLTEFLPVSSSGHLVIGHHLLGLANNLTFDIAVHLGTLLAILIAMRREVGIILQGLTTSKSAEASAGRRLMLMVVIGTIPAAVIGLLLKDAISALFETLICTGLMLVVTGTLLFVAERLSGGQRMLNSISVTDALLIGVAQAFALMPGLSRSGTTLSSGLLRGLEKETAARYAFLLAIPAIAGAAVLELPVILTGEIGMPLSVLLFGVVISAITGYLAIRLLLHLVQRGRLIFFSYYTWLVGLFTIIYSLLNM
ncbi:MAG TPA: undecaprenyl-diphosphate phosphatase [Firmicutes bacterium]|nr:undecaprenyl-diphosphate phosphatase [Bacillota bacterium]